MGHDGQGGSSELQKFLNVHGIGVVLDHGWVDLHDRGSFIVQKQSLLVRIMRVRLVLDFVPVILFAHGSLRFEELLKSHQLVFHRLLFVGKAEGFVPFRRLFIILLDQVLLGGDLFEVQFPLAKSFNQILIVPLFQCCPLLAAINNVQRSILSQKVSIKLFGRQ